MGNPFVVILETQGSEAALASLFQQIDDIVVAKTLHDLLMHAYWKMKNLPAVMAIARAGIGYFDKLGDSAKSDKRIMNYNLASFTWTGWDEPGIVISPADQKLGLAAAQASLQAVREMNLGEIPLARGCWMVGVHHLALKDYLAAIAGLCESESYAAQAGNRGEELLARGFREMAEIEESGGSPAALERFKAELKNLGDDGVEFARQIEVAQRLWLS